MEALERKLRERQEAVERARKQAEEEKIEQEKLAVIAQEKEAERIKELHARKVKLQKHLEEGQKLIFKQCYSRPLYPFNAKLNELQLEKEDYSWLNEGTKKEQQKDIVSKLLEKVTELEDRVTKDVRSNYFGRDRGDLLGGDFDTQSVQFGASDAGTSAHAGPTGRSQRGSV